MTAAIEGQVARPFPMPVADIALHLEDLHQLAAIPKPTDRELRRLAATPRPWDPSTCSSRLRESIYSWLDEVVAWINEAHAWRVDQMIPVCWLEHPHIVHELAPVACLRWSAVHAATAAPLEEWHRTTLPQFLARISQRIGTTGCPPGRHQLHPGASRLGLYRVEPAEAERRRRRQRDACLGDVLR